VLASRRAACDNSHLCRLVFSGDRIHLAANCGSLTIENHLRIVSHKGHAAMNVVPVGDHLVVKRLEAESKTAGGIVLPDSAQQKPQQGRVLSVGDGVQLKNGARAGSQVREGDRIIFANWSGSEVEVNGETLLIMKEHDILAVID
jgi:chaperonin GroES